MEDFYEKTIKHKKICKKCEKMKKNFGMTSA